MIQVKKERDNIFTVDLGIMEQHLLHKMAVGFCLPLNVALAAVINKGLDHYEQTLKEICTISGEMNLLNKKQGLNSGG